MHFTALKKKTYFNTTWGTSLSILSTTCVIMKLIPRSPAALSNEHTLPIGRHPKQNMFKVLIRLVNLLGKFEADKIFKPAKHHALKCIIFEVV